MKLPVIETQGLSIGYIRKGGKRKLVHDGLNLRLYRGEVTCLLGLNGSGKSTLLRTLAGFLPPLAGEIRLLGKPLGDYSQQELALTAGVVLTEQTNAGGITVYDLVSLGRHPYTGFFSQLKPRDHQAIRASLEAAGIVHKAQSYVAELSDGERQKAMIAKTLAQECPVILLDEPTAFLDVTSRIETMILLRRLAREQQKSILLSTHDIDSALQMGDRLWLLETARPLLAGTPEDLILGGAFSRFFTREGITFDPSTGKLTAGSAGIPVGIDGDANTSFWAGNALVRNGFQPSAPSPGRLHIHCQSPTSLTITPPNAPPSTAHSIEELIDRVIVLT